MADDDPSAAEVARPLEELRALCELTEYLHRARLVSSSARSDDVGQPWATPSVRRVASEDLEAVRAVLVDTWHHTYDGVMGVARVTEITDDWHSIASLRAELDRGDHAFLSMELDGVVVATGSASRQADVVTVERLYVHPTRQGRGLGAVLLDALLAQLGPAARVELVVDAANVRAIAFYERHGFVAVGRDGDDLSMRRGSA